MHNTISSFAFYALLLYKDLIILYYEGGIFSIAVLAIFLDRFFGFCAKNFGFSVLVIFAVCGFSYGYM